MNDMTFEKLSARISEKLQAPMKEFDRTVEEVARNFRNLGLTAAVWHPDAIYRANLGGIEAESYIGYSRVEGKWGLIVRTIERDRETRAFVSQRVFTLASCGNIEIVVNALKKVRDLARMVADATERQIRAMEEGRGKFDDLRSSGCKIG